MYDTQKVRELNDAFRTSLKGGRVMMTRGIAARSDLDEIFRRIRSFDAFAPENAAHEIDGTVHRRADALGLALGKRAESGLVRASAEQAGRTINRFSVSTRPR